MNGLRQTKARTFRLRVEQRNVVIGSEKHMRIVLEDDLNGLEFVVLRVEKEHAAGLDERRAVADNRIFNRTYENGSAHGLDASAPARTQDLRLANVERFRC